MSHPSYHPIDGVEAAQASLRSSFMPLMRFSCEPTRVFMFELCEHGGLGIFLTFYPDTTAAGYHI
jgi:hypothetical protein